MAEKPTFLRQDAHKLKRLGDGWKKPRGLQSKMRLAKKGYRKCIKTGYGMANAKKHLTADGKELVTVVNKEQMEALDSKKQVAELPRTLGGRTKVALIGLASEKGITIINYKDPQDFIKNIEEKQKLNKQKKQKRAKKSEKNETKSKKSNKSAAEKEKKVQTTEKKVDSNSVKTEDKKEEARKEKEKIIIKRT